LSDLRHSVNTSLVRLNCFTNEECGVDYGYEVAQCPDAKGAEVANLLEDRPSRGAADGGGAEEGQHGKAQPLCLELQNRCFHSDPSKYSKKMKS